MDIEATKVEDIITIGAYFVRRKGEKEFEFQSLATTVPEKIIQAIDNDMVYGKDKRLEVAEVLEAAARIFRDVEHSLSEAFGLDPNVVETSSVNINKKTGEVKPVDEMVDEIEKMFNLEGYKPL